MSESRTESKWLYVYMIASLLICSLPALLIVALVASFLWGVTFLPVFSLISSWFIPLVCIGVGLFLYPKVTGGKSENWYIGVAVLGILAVLGFWANGNINRNGEFYRLLVNLFGGGT